MLFVVFDRHEFLDLFNVSIYVKKYRKMTD